MKPERHDLVDSLLDDGAAARRASTLRAGGRILRRRRWRRRALAGMAGLAAATLIVTFWPRTQLPRPLALPAPVPPAAQTGSLTDAQLLAMFPDTPVGLVTLKNGQKRLIFPRSTDAHKYIAKF